MKVNPPPDRRKFANAWDEIRHLYDKLLFWLYQREDAGKARPYAQRLKNLLLVEAPNGEVIFAEECWSLVYETMGDLTSAIKHREKEIRLIRRLHDIAGNLPNKNLARRDYEFEDLSDRLDLLATLYHDSGKLNKAITILQESKQLCDAHEIKFDGEVLLREYVAERGLLQPHSERTARLSDKIRGIRAGQRR